MHTEGLSRATPTRSLAPGSIRFLGSVAISVGIQGPTGGILFIPALMAGIVGAAGPLAFLIAVVCMLPVAAVFGWFSRRYASAGSAYVFTGAVLGPVIGFATCFSLFLVYVLYFAASVAGTDNSAQALLGAAGIHVHWLIPAAVIFAAAWLLSYRSIRLSSLLVLVLEGLSLLLVVIIGLVVLLHGGYHHALSLSPFRPSGISAGVLALGIVFAYTGFSGFEGAATVAEETALPRRVIPIAIFASLLVSGVAYAYGSYVETIGYPSADALAKASVPLVDVATMYVAPWVGTVVNIAALISAFGACLATASAAARLLFALGRDGFISEGLAVTHPTHRSPHRALAVAAALAAVAVLGLATTDPLTVFTDDATLGVNLILVVYLATCVAGALAAWRERSPVGVGASVLGVIVLAGVIRYTVIPLPDYPFNLLLALAGVLIAVAVAIPLWPSRFRQRLAESPLFRPRLVGGSLDG